MVPSLPLPTKPDGGYLPNGNIGFSSDSVMGDWEYTYDTLNRLKTGVSLAGSYKGQYGCWSYDSFGNRQIESFQTTVCPSSYTPAYQYNANNQVKLSPSSANGFTYDAMGNVLNDGLNQYAFDAEGRICAVNTRGNLQSSDPAFLGYIYDAAGIRVARGYMSTFSCNFSTNGFVVTTSWALGQGGEQVGEWKLVNGAWAWQHSNAYADGKLLGTYDQSGLHFYFNDWLGTRRIQTNALGQVELTCTSLPYGNGENCTPSALSTAEDPTEQHFTGKERDTESGNDYFEARYYSSSLGRFMSPDWSAKEEPVPYAKLDNPQSLNLYSYVRNNPLVHFDTDGHVLNCVGDHSQCASDLNKIAPGTTVKDDGTVKKGSLFRRVWNHLSGHGDGQSLISSLVNSKTVTGINPNPGDAHGGTSSPGVITYDPAGASIQTRNRDGQVVTGWATGATVLGHELIHEYHSENGGLSPGMGDHVFTDGGRTFTEHWRTEEFRTVGFAPFARRGDITENGLEKEMGQPQRATYLSNYQAVPQQ